jgi:hypothetical protein
MAKQRTVPGHYSKNDVNLTRVPAEPVRSFRNVTPSVDANSQAGSHSLRVVHSLKPKRGK